MNNSFTARQFLLKVSELPEEVQFYFGSEILADFLTELNRNYQAPADLFGELFKKFIVNEFDFYTLDTDLKTALNLSEDQAKQAACDFLGAIFLPAADYLPRVDIRKEIISRGGRLEDYQPYVERLEDEAEKERLNLTQELAEKFEAAIDPQTEAEEALELLRENLVSVLKNKDRELLTGLDKSLIYLLDKQTNFKDQLSRALLENQELLTPDGLVIAGKVAAPTVANWLRDFISKNTSDYFDDLVLSQYLTNSENSRNLNVEEKVWLSKLLNLYRNLKFFPQSMGELPLEQWSVIPLEAEEPKKFKTVAQPERAAPVAAPSQGSALSELTPFELKAMLEAGEITEEQFRKLAK